MNNSSKKLLSKGFVACLLLVLILVCCQFFPAQKTASALSVTDLEGTYLNGATILDENNKYLQTNSYVLANDRGYYTSANKSGYILSSNGVGTTFTSLYIDTLGEGGQVLKGKDSYNGFDAYGYISGTSEAVYKKDKDGNEVFTGYNSVAIKLKYNFQSNNNLLGIDGRTWNISDDTWKKNIGEIASVGVVGKGAVIVQKYVPTSKTDVPTSSSDWKRLNEYNETKTTGVHTVNFFDEYKPEETQNGINIYTPSGEDLQNGLYIKITIAYEISSKDNVSDKKSEYIFKNIVETTTFYLCNTSGEVIFENMYFGSKTETSENVDEVESSCEQKSGAITNNQGSVDGFRLNTLDSNYDIKYYFNNSTKAQKCNDGKVFLNPGKYDFVITTDIGVVRTKTVYIHENNIDANKKVYFGDSLFSSDSIKILSLDSIYPVYAKGYITLETQNENSTGTKHAPLVGKVYRFNGDWEDIERDEKGLPTSELVATKSASDHCWSLTNLENGNYEAVFANNENYFDGETSGDTYVFVWRFSVQDAQDPIVNKSLFENSSGVSSYKSLNYAVKLKTNGTGNLIVCFDDEESVYDFACEYLVGIVQKTSSGYVLDETIYENEKELLVALRQKAQDMVFKRYFDLTNQSSYLTIKNNNIRLTINEKSNQEDIDEYNNFKSLLSSKLNYDVVVFYDETFATNDSTSNSFLNDISYAYVNENGDVETGKNSLYFISVLSDESSSITLYYENSNLSYAVPYGVSVQTFLEIKNAPTGKYKIVEKNHTGETIYYGIYIKSGDIKTTISLERTFNGITTINDFSKENEGTRLRANKVVIKNISNIYDEYGIIKISKNGKQISIYQIDEFNDIPEICEIGNYEITLVDRLGNSFSFAIDIYEEDKSYSFSLQDNGKIVYSAKAFGGSVFALETLVSSDENLCFVGWKDENGDIFTENYTFNSTKDITLTAVWKYKNVEIVVCDGKVVETYTSEVGTTRLLPSLSKDGYKLYGFKYEQEDGLVRFFRGQIKSVPNVKTVKLDAIWVKNDETENLISGENEEVKIYLINGCVEKTLTINKGESVELENLTDENLEFAGWIYQYKLTGTIFSDLFSYDEVCEIGIENENIVKLNAIWKTKEETINETKQFSASELTCVSSLNSSTTKTSSKTTPIVLGILGALIVSLLFGLLIYFKNRKKVSDLSIDNNKETKINNDYKPKKHKFLKFIKKAFIPCVVFVLCLTLLVNSQFKLISSVKEKIDSAILTAQIEKEEENELEFEQQKQAQEELLINTYSKLESAFENDAEQDESLVNEANFLCTVVYLDLIAMGYEPFPAIASCGDKNVIGIGYTNYAELFEDDDENLLFGAGFIGIDCDNKITVVDVEQGVLLTPILEDEVVTTPEYVVTFTEEWGQEHYIAYERYVKYQVYDFELTYTSVQDNGVYDDTLGYVYNYDLGEISHYSNYGNSFEFDSYGINSINDYTKIYEILTELLQQQDQKALAIDSFKVSYISSQALNDYIANNQDETMLGISAEDLLYFESQISSTMYYVIYADGSVAALEIPPDPARQATLTERICMAIASAAAMFLGIVAYSIPGVGPGLGGAIISAAIDIFSQVTIFGTSVLDINWTSVAISAAVGFITAGIGNIFSALTKAAVSGIKSVVAKFFTELGIQFISGMFSGATRYLVTIAVLGEEFNLDDCLKSVIIGGVASGLFYCGEKAVSAIGTKIQQIRIQKATGEKPLQVHHFLTNKSSKFTSKFKNVTDKYGLDLDGSWNKELLPHQGRHPYDYHNNMLGNVRSIDKIANGNTKKFLKLFEKVKTKIRKNPEMLYKKYYKDLLKLRG